MAVAAAVLAALCISLIIFHLHNLQDSSEGSLSGPKRPGSTPRRTATPALAPPTTSISMSPAGTLW